jgi:ABC-type spermidine/putrescine transport system permease subunit I
VTSTTTRPGAPSAAEPQPRPRPPARPWAHRGGWLVLPAVLFVVVVFVLPFLGVARVSVAGIPAPGTGTFFDIGVLDPGALASVAGDRLFRSVLGVTIRMGVIITVVCMLIAVPFAAYIHTRRGAAKAALIAVVAVPKLVNLLVLLYGVVLTLGASGVINRTLLATGVIDRPLPMFGNLFAVVFTEVLVVVPYPILLLVAAFQASDQRQLDAARSLGAGPVRAYLETVIRPAWPAVVGAGIISAVWAVGAFVGPLVLGNPPYYTIAVEVYLRALERLAWVEAAGWAVLGVMTFGAVLGGAAWGLRRWERRRPVVGA